LNRGCNEELIMTTKITSRLLNTAPILTATDTASIAIMAGTKITIDSTEIVFEDAVSLSVSDPQPGTDYAVRVHASGEAEIVPVADANPLDGSYIGGFHFAPGGNATARAGGDTVPAINPYSVWDIDFRPEAMDPRGMAMIEGAYGRRFWMDIYLLGVDHEKNGTSRFGVKIADGRSPAKLDYYDAVNTLASHGKHLPTYEQFIIAAFGVNEKSAADRDPDITGLDAARTSRHGLMQATGNLWVWGTDGDPDDPRPSIFGGSWFSGSDAGSRCATLDDWAGDSCGALSARGASDHLQPD
ncbi:MAG: hypothetical protein JZU55_00930, partial [Afipia sp.]|nr:hypothetical protein [Afipia sp.]